MKKIIYFIFVISSVSCILLSCSKDDNVELANAYTDLSTVDYLKANRFKMFDMILELYEKAGYLDLLNQTDVTVVIPSDYSVRHYLAQKEYILQEETGNENLTYTFENLIQDLPLYKDSLLMYIIEKPINRSTLLESPNESLFVNSKMGTNMQIYLQQTKLYTGNVPNSVNKYLYYKYIVNGLDDPNVDINSIPFEDRDVTNYCQTSGIITRTGILHVLRDEHRLFFNKMYYR